ncbi:MAG: OadG family protein [Clostridia bacterium]|nr:OadG family protein [Clostridia bacterium]
MDFSRPLDLSNGLLVTLIGMLIVIFGLTVLIFLIKLLLSVTGGIGKKKTAPQMPAKSVQAAPPTSPAEEEAAEENQDELIAVITAAIACMMDTAPGNGFVVKHVRRISNAPAWQKKGREEQILSRF